MIKVAIITHVIAMATNDITAKPTTHTVDQYPIPCSTAQSHAPVIVSPNQTKNPGISRELKKKSHQTILSHNGKMTNYTGHQSGLTPVPSNRQPKPLRQNPSGGVSLIKLSADTLGHT